MPARRGSCGWFSGGLGSANGTTETSGVIFLVGLRGLFWLLLGRVPAKVAGGWKPHRSYSRRGASPLRSSAGRNCLWLDVGADYSEGRNCKQLDRRNSFGFSMCRSS